jgi:hypothetical protein
VGLVGASLNRHVHYHCCVIDGVFERADNGSRVCGAVRLRPASKLTPQTIAIICEKVRVRVLRWLARSGLIDSDDVCEILPWENSGFSLDAEVWIAARDRAGVERLLRYWARPQARANVSSRLTIGTSSTA